MKADNSEKGSILIVALLVLLLASVTCILMVTTSTLETRITGNDLIYTKVFYGAEGGIAPGAKVLLDTVMQRRVSGYANLEWTEDTAPNELTNKLLDEIFGFEASETGKGFSYRASGGDAIRTEVRIQRDVLTSSSSGGSAELGAGYEGLGCGSNGSVHIPFFIRSTAEGASGSRARIEAKYRKVVGVGEGD
jgi:hypothetical protein